MLIDFQKNDFRRNKNVHLICCSNYYVISENVIFHIIIDLFFSRTYGKDTKYKINMIISFKNPKSKKNNQQLYVILKKQSWRYFVANHSILEMKMLVIV